MSLLWNLNRFHTLFWCLPRWIWTSMCQLERWNNYSLQWNSEASKNFNESRQNSITVNLFYFSLPKTAKFPENRMKRSSERPTANEQTERWSYKLTILHDSRWKLIRKILKVKLHLILNFAQTPENIYLLWKNGLVVRALIPNSKIVRSKPLGGSKVDSAFHTSKVHQMSTTTTSRGHSGKK